MTKQEMKRKEIIGKIDNALNSVNEKVLRETADFSNYDDLGIVFFDAKSGKFMQYDRYRHAIHNRDTIIDVQGRYIDAASSVGPVTLDICAKATEAGYKAGFVVKC